MTYDPCQTQNRTGPVGFTPPPCASMPRWHVYYTRPRGEIATDVALRQAGMETYLPLEMHRRSDRSKVIRPLFPRYTFGRFDAAEFPWRSVVRNRAHEEVAQVMRSPAGKPLSVPDAVVEALLAQCQANRVIYPEEPREMRRGDVGAVLAGPLAQFHGICSRTTRDRVWLLLDILGRKSEVSFARPQVEIATAS